jgi:SDR family mycofactocin-dependent oxidoreductase
MGMFDGRVVLISGVARGQGRSHALRFAREGARVIGFDVCADAPTNPFALATPVQLEETTAALRATGSEAITAIADVRSTAEIEAVVKKGLSAFGTIDILVANAGIVGPIGPTWELDDAAVLDVLDVNLAGAWRTAKAAVPHLLASPAANRSIIFTSSGAGVRGIPNIAPYVASKHGVIGLMRSMAKELGPRGVRVNAVLPGNVDTPMFMNDAIKKLFFPDMEGLPTEDEFAARASAGSPMGLPWVDVDEITEAVVWLASDAARRVTGILLPVDAGTAIP